MDDRSLKEKDEEIFSLKEVPKGACVEIIGLPKGLEKSRLIRLGLLEGEVVQCLECLPGGTVIIGKDKQEIAIGAKLAKLILVKFTEGSQRRKRYRRRFGFLKLIQ